jgi:oligo-1,6-glucosidase/alpha-glucosidase
MSNKILFAFLLNALSFAFLNSNAQSANDSTQNWWKQTTIYQIYPRSFYDTNGDGIGDIKGIIQKLDYIQSLGFETIWCSPFFASPQKDFGYDVSDYTSISPEFGTLEDAENLIQEVHKRHMKIVLDMVMNHTSDQHKWFLESAASKTNPKSDWYLWRDKPNNWKSMVGGSGWQYVASRNQYYWASFLPFQPDLNYRNPEVKKAMFDNVRFWLAKGADGYRLDIFNVIYKDKGFRDNPFSWDLLPSESNPSGFFQQAKYTMNQSETFEFARELRAVTKEFGDKILLGEVSGDIATIRKFMGNEKNDGLGLVFDFEMLPFHFKAKYFSSLISKIETHFQHPFTPVYVFSNHDRRRSATRIKGNLEKAKLLQLLQLTVRGVPCMYYGEEIGMTDGRFSYRKGLDPIAQKNKWVARFLTDAANETLNRDDLRTPMQWDTTKNAGFSSADKTWLPANKNFGERNVVKESEDSSSILSEIKTLLRLRNEYEALKNGSIEIVKEKSSKDLLCYRRKDANQTLLVVINFGEKKIQLPADFTKGKILYAVKNSTANFIAPLGATIILEEKK